MFEPLEVRRLLSSMYSLTLDGAVQGTSDFDVDMSSTQLLLLNAQHDFSGTAKNDVILVSPGGAANAVRVSVNGAVTLTTADQPITLRGNAGNDKIHLDLGDAAAAFQFVIYGGAGDDTIVGGTCAERIIAGDGNDNVNGLGGRDTIYAEGGDDSIRGGGSSDLLDGGAGNDTVRGDAGNDRLLGGDGFDRLRGSAGNDSCEGGASKDFIGGETGDDQLAGEGGDDVLAGGEGNDLLYGGAGDDVCDGNDGDDLLAGGSGSNDQLFGHGGNDGFAAGDEPHECADIQPEDLEAGMLELAAGNTVSLTKTGAGTVVLTGSNSYDSSGSMNVANGGVTGGTVKLNTNPLPTTGTLVVGNALTGTGKLDISDNKLITIGSGSAIDTAGAFGGLTTIGVATASQGGSFGGQTLSTGDTLVMYTYGGDANLDGVVNGDDYLAIDTNVLTSSGWYQGDFNYDGVISGDDYSIIDYSILAQGAPFPTGGGGITAVGQG